MKGSQISFIKIEPSITFFTEKSELMKTDGDSSKIQYFILCKRYDRCSVCE